MTTLPERSCGRCEFMSLVLRHANGVPTQSMIRVCRRNPPAVEMIEVRRDPHPSGWGPDIVTRAPITNWPEIAETDWCGEFKPRQIEPPAQLERQPIGS